MTQDPYVLAAIAAYRSEPVTLAQLARMLGIGEKTFSKIVKMDLARFSQGGATLDERNICVALCIKR